MRDKTCECCAVVEQVKRDLHDVVYRTPKGPQVFEELLQILELVNGGLRHCRKVNKAARREFKVANQLHEADVPGQAVLFDDPAAIEVEANQNRRAMTDQHGVRKCGYRPTGK